jgi:hypothetical protein
MCEVTLNWLIITPLFLHERTQLLTKENISLKQRLDSAEEKLSALQKVNEVSQRSSKCKEHQSTEQPFPDLLSQKSPKPVMRLLAHIGSEEHLVGEQLRSEVLIPSALYFDD